MTVINKSKEKREKAGKTIKENWSKPEFRNKMMKRKPKYRLVSPNGEELFIDGFSKMIKQFNFNATLVRKYKDTGQPVQQPEKQLNQKTLNTIGWTFYELKKDK